MLIIITSSSEQSHLQRLNKLVDMRSMYWIKGKTEQLHSQLFIQCSRHISHEEESVTCRTFTSVLRGTTDDSEAFYGNRKCPLPIAHVMFVYLTLSHTIL